MMLSVIPAAIVRVFVTLRTEEVPLKSRVMVPEPVKLRLATLTVASLSLRVLPAATLRVPVNVSVALRTARVPASRLRVPRKSPAAPPLTLLLMVTQRRDLTHS